MNKRKFILIGIFVLLVICLYVSIAYSYYLIGNDKVEIETAMESPSCVGISIDSGEAFSLNGDYAVPITNAQFLNSKPETQDIYKYSFTITNSCEGEDLNGLTIGLVPLNGSDLPISKLKYILIKSDENTNSFTENNIKEFTDESVKKLPMGMMQQLSNSYGESATNVYPVGSTSLSGIDPISYDLYVWIGSSAGNETMDETFNAAVVLYDEETIIDVLLKSDPGNGELLHHTEDLPNSAEDGGYRYSGDDPNNFICFGKGSEKYNWGKEDSCPLENKYRIIGYVPVEVNGNIEFRVKVIKAEYLTETEFPNATKAGTALVSSTYEGIKRIESPQSGIPSYKWNDTENNNWRESSLYTSLNSPDYINKAFGENWKDKIETVTWNVGGVSTSGITPKEMYEAETTNGGCYINNCDSYPIEQGSGTTVEAQIGLMYVHDYGFAASSINWNSSLGSYRTDDNRNNNWLFNGVLEWTISRVSSNATDAFHVSGTGFVYFIAVTTTGYAVRPVFYLKSDVNLIKEETANGSKAHPFKIADSPEPTPTLLDVCPESGNLAECFQNIGNKNIDVGDGELLHHDGTIMGIDYADYESSYSVTDSCFGKKYDNVSDIILEDYYGGYILRYNFTDEEIQQIFTQITSDDLWNKYFEYSYHFVGDAADQAISDGCLEFTPHEIILDAQDGGYRYSGNQPNNYICFGLGSDDYNNGKVGSCPIKNKYRIIGYVPVTVEDEINGQQTKNLVKVIKAEYLTKDEFPSGNAVRTAEYSTSYAGIKRIESAQSGIPSYEWDDSSSIWKDSTLYTSLNSDEAEGYKNTAFGDTWLDKIETVTWNVGGVGSSYRSYNAQKMYEAEMNNQGLTATVKGENSLIGLMYVHDYGFASSSENWWQTLDNYGTNIQNMEKNWLFNGVCEWTISRSSSYSSSTLYVSSSGFVIAGNVFDSHIAVRPVFYLKSDVEIINDGTHVGTRENPLRIGI